MNVFVMCVMWWMILFVVIVVCVIGVGVSVDGWFEAAFAFARRLARSVGGGDDERIVLVNGCLYDVFGVVVVLKCFLRCVVVDVLRLEV